jgi:hypothetical protein
LSFRLSFRPSVAAFGSLALVATLAVAVPPVDAVAQEPAFSDLDQTIHAEAIELVAADGIAGGFPDGTFRPRNDVRRDQMATFLANALELDEVPSTFPDVPAASPHFGRIGAIADARITQGFPDGTYRPLATVTRGQMARFLTEGFDLPPGEATFDDVPPGYVHADAIAALASSGITSGYPDGTFRPNLPVKRDQMAAFLAKAVPLPREPECPAGYGTFPASPQPQRAARVSPASDRESEDVAGAVGPAGLDSTGVPIAEEPTISGDTGSLTAETIGPAVPPTVYPASSAVRVDDGALEVHSFDFSDSRSARVTDDGGPITTYTVGAAGRRTWATTALGSTVYLGQWGAGSSANLWRYDASSTGVRTATAVATVPTGNEFWALTTDPRGQLWAGTRAHAGGAFRQSVGLATQGFEDQRHVVHRIDPADGAVTNVLFAAPCIPTLESGLRPDVKQLTTVDNDLFVGLGQQSGGARIYRFDVRQARTSARGLAEVPAEAVTDVTPPSIRSGEGVFALTSDESYVVAGTRGVAPDVSPRLVVFDARTGLLRVDVPLPGEARVDAVAIEGRQVVAATQSGSVYQAVIPGSTSTPPSTSAVDLGWPVSGEVSRFVEITDVVGNDVALRGVTQLGKVWTRSTDGTFAMTDVFDRGAPAQAGFPQGIHAGAAELVVAANSAVVLRDASDPTSMPRRVTITGEAKSVTSAPDGTSFVASYSPGALHRVPAGAAADSTGQQIARWDQTFLRPAGAAYDDRGSTPLVHVIAREDNNPQTVTVNGQPVQFRASNLFSLRADETTSDSDPSLDGRPIFGRVPGTGDRTAVEASAIALPVDGDGVLVGDTLGGVQLAHPDGSHQWHRSLSTDAPRTVVDLELVDQRVVATTSGPIVGGSGATAVRTVVYELDVTTGDVIEDRTRALQTGGVQSIGVNDAISVGAHTVVPWRRSSTQSQLLALDRNTGTTTVLETASPGPDTFGGPYAALLDDCSIVFFAGRDLVRSGPAIQHPGCPSADDR